MRAPRAGAFATNLCPHCNGTGWVLAGESPGVHPAVEDWEGFRRPCAVCGGDGRIDAQDIRVGYDLWVEKALDGKGPKRPMLE